MPQIRHLTRTLQACISSVASDIQSCANRTRHAALVWNLCFGIYCSISATALVSILPLHLVCSSDHFSCILASTDVAWLLSAVSPINFWRQPAYKQTPVSPAKLRRPLSRPRISQEASTCKCPLPLPLLPGVQASIAHISHPFSPFTTHPHNPSPFLSPSQGFLVGRGRAVAAPLWAESLEDELVGGPIQHTRRQHAQRQHETFGIHTRHILRPVRARHNAEGKGEKNRKRRG